ncbi:hypothetical protein LINPERHAP2_LOCUS39524 [Linum perenne]
MMKDTPVYNLIKSWKPILEKKKENKLKLEVGDEIELWSFRVASGLLQGCFREALFCDVSDETRKMVASSNEIAKKGTSIDSGRTQK